MSLPTPGTLVRHELCGLPVAVAAAPNPDLVGVGGRVVGETTRTLLIEGAAGGADDHGRSRVRQVPKSGTVFEFALTDEAAAGPDVGPRRDRRDGDDKSAGTASKPGSETAGTGTAPAAGMSGSVPQAGDAETGGDPGNRDGEGVAYVTVDGARLLSRPARRTETGGVSKWR